MKSGIKRTKTQEEIDNQRESLKRFYKTPGGIEKRKRFGELSKVINKGRSPSIKNKTYEEFFGKEKAGGLKKNLSMSHKGQHNSSKTQFKQGHEPWNTNLSVEEVLKHYKNPNKFIGIAKYTKGKGGFWTGKKLSEEYRLNGKCHRTDGPAYISWYPNGQKIVFRSSLYQPVDHPLVQ